MDLLITLLLVLAVILCGLAGFGVGASRVHLGWLGAAAAFLAALLGAWPGV